MLGLGEQVERERMRVGALRGEHQQVAGPGEAVDPDRPDDLPLGLLHVQVARAGDDVHGLDLSVPKASAAIACAPPMR